MHNTRVWRLGTTELPPPRPKQPCAVEGCDRPPISHGYCSTHWRRIQKHGDPSIVLRGGRTRSGKATTLKNGYVMVYEPEHPLAGKSGQVAAHRKVLYDKIGPGWHTCHECGRPVAWGEPRPDRLDVDHLDRDRQNNDSSNLAPSCHKCNDGQAARRQTHCVNGHEFTSENTYVDPNGYRRCRTCMREAEKRRVRTN